MCKQIVRAALAPGAAFLYLFYGQRTVRLIESNGIGKG